LNNIDVDTISVGILEVLLHCHCQTAR